MARKRAIYATIKARGVVQFVQPCHDESDGYMGGKMDRAQGFGTKATRSNAICLTWHSANRDMLQGKFDWDQLSCNKDARAAMTSRE